MVYRIDPMSHAGMRTGLTVLNSTGLRSSSQDDVRAVVGVPECARLRPATDSSGMIWCSHLPGQQMLDQFHILLCGR